MRIPTKIHFMFFTVIFATTLGGILPMTHALADSKEEIVQKLQVQMARFAPTKIFADLSRLTASDQAALQKIIAAAKLMDSLFLDQVWSGNAKTLARLENCKCPVSQTRLKYFHLNKGPWSRLDQDERFIPWAPELKPKQANFYPDDMTREEFEKWVNSLSPEDQHKATSFFHTIRRDQNHHLKAVPYSEEYRQYLEPAAQLLKEAASLTSSESLKKFLNLRAEAFLSNRYYESDLAWMKLDSPIDVTFGPYETYEDGLFGYKAAFEAFVTIRDDEESEKLAQFSAHLHAVEAHLPIDPKHRESHVGFHRTHYMKRISPIHVVNVVYTSGDANRGVQTAAFNLPNDENIVKEVGSKKVLLKNIQEAKFNKVLLPIADLLLETSQRSDVTFHSFFTHILAHELSHSIGPHKISVNGRETTARLELKDTYSTIEEAKADVTGLFLLQYLMDHGHLDPKLEKEIYTTYLASIFRSVRFGLTEAHALGTALQFNFFLEHGGIHYNETTGKFSVRFDKIKKAIELLDHQLLTLEAEGAYESAQQFIARYAVMSSTLEKALSHLGEVPVDIAPIFNF